jgi:hypothetical protein
MIGISYIIGVWTIIYEKKFLSIHIIFCCQLLNNDLDA